MKLNTKDISTFLFTVLTGVLIVIAFISYLKINQFKKSVDAVMHSNLVKNQILAIETNLKDASNAQRGYLLTQDPALFSPFKQAEQSKYALLVTLDSSMSEKPEQQENLIKLTKLVNERYKYLNKSLIDSRNDRPDSLIRSTLLYGESLMVQLQDHISIMLKAEDDLLLQRTQVKDRSADVTPLFLLVLSLFSILVITGFFFFLQKEMAERISISESNILLQEANQKIEASEKRFRMLTETIPHMIWTASPDGNKNFFNQYFLDYAGLPYEELRGEGMFKIIYVDDLQKDLELWDYSLRTGEEFNIEKRLRRHDGTYRWHLSRAIAQRDSNGEITEWIGTSTDITEQKNFSEELELKVKERTEQLQIRNQTFEFAENIANFGSYKWNLTTGELEYSDNLFRLFDCEPQEFIPSYEKFLSFIHPDDLQEVLQNGEKTRTSAQIGESPYRIISKKGAVKYMRSNGRFTGNDMLIGTMQDISQDILASIDLKAKNHELEDANAELASFNYIASHDLQEPLRKIRGFSKRITDTAGDSLTDKTKDYFDRINGAAERMQNLIESLISFSRINLSETSFEETDLNQTLNEVQNVLHEKITQKNAIIEAQILPTLKAVQVQMHQLFLNLISNSLKYSKEDIAPHIKITADKVKLEENSERIKQNGEFWKITFTDNGIGFEQQYENKIFELFQRLHGKTEYEGTGIGLAICKKIVQTHKGIISGKGELGKGAVFTLYLPANNNNS